MVFDIVPYLHENYHVWVVKTPWASYIKEMALVFAVIIDNFRHTIPGVLNVIIVSPNIATLCNRFVIWLKKSLMLKRAATIGNGVSNDWG